MRLIIIAVVAVVAVVVAGVAGFFLIGPMFFGSEEEPPLEAEQPAAADTKAESTAEGEAAPRRRAVTTKAAEGRELGSFEVGPTVEIAERVVNLSGEGPFSVLQVTIVLEFAATDEIAEAGPDEKPGLVEVFKAEVEPAMALIEDGINTIISARSGEKLLTEDGKKELKDDITIVANEFAAPHTVIGVYFTKFFLQ